MGQKEHFFPHNTHDLELCLLVYFIVFPYIKKCKLHEGRSAVWLASCSIINSLCLAHGRHSGWSQTIGSQHPVTLQLLAAS